MEHRRDKRFYFCQPDFDDYLYCNCNRSLGLYCHGNTYGNGAQSSECYCICYAAIYLCGSKQRGYSHRRRHLPLEYGRYDGLYHCQPCNDYYLYGNRHGNERLHENCDCNSDGTNPTECYCERISCCDLCWSKQHNHCLWRWYISVEHGRYHGGHYG